MYFPSPDGSATGNLVVLPAMAVQGHGAEESSAGESKGMGGIPIIEMLEDGSGGTTNITGGARQAAARNNVNEGAEMPIAMLTAKHRETGQ